MQPRPDQALKAAFSNISRKVGAEVLKGVIFQLAKLCSR